VNTPHEKNYHSEHSAGFMPLKPILVADDDVNDLDIFRVRARKCEVKNPLVFVCDGDEAMAYLRKETPFESAETPSMVFLDLKMPRMGGLQFLAWMRTQPKPDFPIIVFSSLHDLNQMREAYQMGAHSFLLKPVEQREFCDFLEKFKGIEMSRCSF